MKLSPLVLRKLEQFITGEDEVMPTKSGKDLIALFNAVGIKDVYEQGMPESLSRTQYTRKQLTEINGTIKLQNLLELLVSPAWFDVYMPIAAAIKKMNTVLMMDGFRFEEIDDTYKIIGDNLIEETSTEVHFEEIQAQIIEQIQQAKFLIWVAVAWITDPVILREIYKRKLQGVNVQIIMIDDEINQKSGLNVDKHFDTYLKKPSGPYSNIMHDKFCVIDLKVVIHGSYNWTKKAQYNKETFVIEKGRENAEKFATEFIKLKLS